MCWNPIPAVVKYLLNIIISAGIFPASWKRAIVTPIPKISQPTAFSDLRPISVTPMLSRLLELLIVRKFILLPLPKTLL
jgi:hypothetical protein